MPRLSSTGSALMGVAGVPLSIDGATPALFAAIPSGYWQWMTPTLICGQADFGGGFHFYTSASPYAAVVQVSTNGANWNIAGGSVWAAWLGGTGVFTSIGGWGPFPLGYTLHTSFQGESALLTSYAAGSGIRIYDATGAQIDAVNGTLVDLPPATALACRDGVMTYRMGSGYLLRDYLNQINLSVLIRSDEGNWSIPVFDGTDYWLLERSSGDILSIRKKDSTTAWQVAGPAATLFSPDVMLLSAGVVRIAWSTTIGEEAANLIVMDLTLATGANDLATVVAGALVFVPQAALSSVTVTGTLSPGGGGSGGGAGGGPTSPGQAVLNRRAAPPPAVKEPEVYPHVPLITDYHTQQSIKLAWGKLAAQAKLIDAQQARLDAQDADLAQLRADLTNLAQGSNVTFKGVDE